MSREWDSSSYHRLSEPQFAWGLKVLSQLSLRGDETVLDAGCGTGRVTAELARLLPRGRVIAVDLSRNMVEKAREQAAPNIRITQADLAALPFRSAFDGVFSTAVFHWVPDHSRLFRDIHTALKTGGWLVAQCGGGPNLAKLKEKSTRVISQPPFAVFFQDWREPTHYETPDATAERLHRVGFVDVKTSLESAPRTFDDVKTYQDFIATVTLHPHMARIPDPTLKQKYLDLITEQAQAEGALVLDYWRLNIRAKKSGDRAIG